jgi:hypothetical protein
LKKKIRVPKSRLPRSGLPQVLNSHNANKFTLGKAVERVWRKEGTALTPESKLHIQRLARMQTSSEAAFPNSEEELQYIQRLQRSVFDLSLLEPKATEWVTEEALALHSKINYFLAAVANEFYLEREFDHPKYNDWIDCLCTFIKSNKRVHVGLLNYDNLIYQPFATKEIFGRYDQALLVDGFTGRPPIFGSDKMERRFDNHFGWYMHLHGTPMFVTDPRAQGSQAIQKIPNYSVKGFLEFLNNSSANTPQFHIVLTAQKFKSDVIEGSRILSAYWDRLREALAETNQLVLFGYGGCDSHLNSVIKDWIIYKHRSRQDFAIHIVSYIDNIHHGTWVQRLIPFSLQNDARMKIKILPFENILDYKFDSLTERATLAS